MARIGQRRGKRKAAADAAQFQHVSEHPDLKTLVEDHLIDPVSAEATSGWRPSRRGNSPRSAPKTEG